MIMDRLENLPAYLPASCRRAVMEFVRTLTPETPVGRYDILGEQVFARVLAYQTAVREDCRIEAHERYVDIQSTLVGAEGIDVFERGLLTEEVCYNQEKDIVFFQPEDAVPFASNTNFPGYFSMIFPQEAHRPQQSVPGESTNVKKFVIKLEWRIFENER